MPDSLAFYTESDNPPAEEARLLVGIQFAADEAETAGGTVGATTAPGIAAAPDAAGAGATTGERSSTLSAAELAVRLLDR